MKKIILLLCFVPFIGFAQELPKDENGKITYKEVIEVNGKTSSEIYLKSLEWFALKYNSANNLIQLKDDINNKIIGKGQFSISYYSRNPTIDHTIVVETKDAKARVTIMGLYYKDVQNDQFYLETFPFGWGGKKKLYNTVNQNILEIINDLKIFLNKSNNDW
jgi:hypothetical protein